MIPNIEDRIKSLIAGYMPVMHGKLATECSEEYRGEVTIDRYKQREGDDLWAIKNHGSLCLAKDGCWEYEPMPSSRNDEFIESCRYDSMEEAFAYFQRWSAWAIEKFHQGIIYGTHTWDDETFPYKTPL